MNSPLRLASAAPPEARARTGAPIVQKYGGSSVANVDRLRSIADKIGILARTGQPVVVVVSAMGTSTNQLLDLAEQASNAAGTRQLPQRELDMLVSTGERVTTAVLAIILCGLGVRAVSLTGSQSGIVTDEAHFNARILAVRPQRILRALESGEVPVVAGYQGMSTSREITTLGRGGSDTTAVALAAALTAHCCEIYSDVDGVYTSDPRRVAAARHLPKVGYQFMWDMAHAGARVLNAEAVRLARTSRVPIIARETFAHATVPRETRIEDDYTSAPALAVVELKDVLELRGSIRQWARLRDYAKSTGVVLEDAERHPEGFRVWVRRDLIATRALEQFTLDSISIRDGLSLVSVIASEPARLRLADAALRGYPVIRSSSGHRLSTLVATEHASELTQRLHAACIESVEPTALAG